MSDKYRYIKNIKTGVICYWHKKLAEKKNMEECDVKGNALYVPEAPKAPKAPKVAKESKAPKESEKTDKEVVDKD